jgi:hypothetical protein
MLKQLARIIPDMVENFDYNMNRYGYNEIELVQHYIAFYTNELENAKKVVSFIIETGRKPNDASGTPESNLLLFNTRIANCIDIIESLEALLL